MAKTFPLLIANLRGGRNDSDPPTQLPDDQCQEALNVDWWEGTVANKRQGSTALSTTFSAGGPFAGAVTSLIRHVPGNDETAAELWAVDAGNVVGRLAGAVTFTAPTLADASTDGASWVGASLDGKLFVAYDSAQNRLHVWDGSSVRRVGLATPAAAPTTTTLGGSGNTFTRSYRVRWVHLSGSTVVRRSEPSATDTETITDDSGVQVTRPTAAGEGETHWEVEYADTTAGPWYRASQVAIATTTYDDTAATISTTNLSDSTGQYLPPPSFRYIVATDNRLLGAGCFETSGGYIDAKNNRVWWTPVIGTADTGDAERIVTNTTLGRGYLDVEAAITGLGLLGSTVYVFGYRRIWALEPTGQLLAPFRRFSLDTGGIGCIAHKTIVQTEDENGTPCLGFLSHKGPYRIGPNGLQYLGGDLETLWATVNLGATSPPHGVYHSDKHQVWWFIPVSPSTEPSQRIVFDVKLGRTVAGDAVRKGWARHTGSGANAYASVMFSNTVAASMSRDLKPYIGQSGAANRIWKCDSTATDDAGATFQAYVETKELGTLGFNHEIRSGVLVGQVASGVTVTVTPVSDFGLASVDAGTALLTAAGSETRVQKRLEALQCAGVGTFVLRIGDASAASNQWTVDAVTANVTQQEPKS